jgi:DNA repair exonuclease SbcCD ATPase subunit
MASPQLQDGEDGMEGRVRVRVWDGVDDDEERKKWMRQEVDAYVAEARSEGAYRGRQTSRYDELQRRHDHLNGEIARTREDVRRAEQPTLDIQAPTRGDEDQRRRVRGTFYDNLRKIDSFRTRLEHEVSAIGKVKGRLEGIMSSVEARAKRCRAAAADFGEQMSVLQGCCVDVGARARKSNAEFDRAFAERQEVQRQVDELMEELKEKTARVKDTASAVESLRARLGETTKRLEQSRRELADKSLLERGQQPQMEIARKGAKAGDSAGDISEIGGPPREAPGSQG